MAKPSIRAATAYCAFPEGTTMDEAWEQISRPFRGRTSSEEATNFVNAAYLEACGPMDSPSRLNERGIYSYRRPGSASDSYIRMVDVKHGQGLSYEEISKPENGFHGDITKDHVHARMDFRLAEEDGKVNLVIARREKLDLSIANRLTRKFDNHTAVQLAALISGGAEQLPETGIMTYSRGMFDKVFITPDEENRLEF